MRNSIGIMVLLALAGCSGASRKDTKECKSSALYGYVNFCLPEITGMMECKAHKGVQEVIQPYLATGPVLGYYLDNETYKKADNLKDITYENYFLMYGEYRLENYNARKPDLEQAEKGLEQTLFEGNNFEQISSRVEEYYKTMTVGKPALIEKYVPRENVRAMVVLMKYKSGDSETTVVSVVNFILLKNRLFNLAHYVAYEGGKSIDKAKNENNAFLDKLFKAN